MREGKDRSDIRAVYIMIDVVLFTTMKHLTTHFYARYATYAFG